MFEFLGQADPLVEDKSETVELVVAGGRLLIASVALAALQIDPSKPAWFADVTYILLFAYSLHSLAAFVAICGFGMRPTNRFILGTHAIDVLWPTLISAFTVGPRDPFYLLYLWVLLAAAYRWGLQQTIFTSVACIILLTAQDNLLASAPLQAFFAWTYDPRQLLLKSVFLLVLSLGIGYVAEEERQARHATFLLSALIANARVDWGLNRSLQVALGMLKREFGAQAAILVCRNQRRAIDALIRVEGNTPESTAWQEIDHSQGAQYCDLVLPVSGKEVAEHPPVALLSKRQIFSQSSFPWNLFFGEGVSRIIAAELPGLPDWQIRLFLTNPTKSGAEASHLLRRIIIQVSPSFYNVYLLRQLRSRAEALERSRLARELHDGTLQSLFALRLQLSALRTRHNLPPDARSDLERIQQLLRSEMVELRGLMQRMSDADVEPAHLVGALADTVAKFDRESGIAALFSSHCSEVQLSPGVCRELLRITEEALINVHKHSLAHKVKVDLSQLHGIYRLSIEDDGTGFGFRGHYTAAQLDQMNKGPVSIKKRAKSIGAQLTLESAPDRGSRLEVLLIPAADRKYA